MLNAFLISWAVAFVFTVIREFMNPMSMLRGMQEEVKWGGIVFFFFMTSLTFGVILWGVFSLCSWVFGQFS